MIRARGVRPSARALSSSMISTAAAPSEIWEDVPAVCRPSWRTGLRPASPSAVVSRRPWSASTAGLAGGLAVLVENRGVDRRDLALEPALVPRDPGLLLGGQAERVEVARGSGRGGRRSGRRPRTGWACRCPSRPAAGRPACAGRWRRAGSGTSTRRRRRCRRRWCRRRPCRHQVADCWPEPHWASMVVAGVLGEPGVQPGRADHVVGLLAGLGDAAADDLVDQLRVDPGPLGAAPAGLSPAARPRAARQPAVALAERRADGVDDHRRTHGGASWLTTPRK